MENLPILRGEKVYLGPIPNSIDFYKKYLSWLNLERIRIGTGSQECNLEEVIEMHEEWKSDPENHTFCIYDIKTNEPIGDVCLRHNLLEDYGNDNPEVTIMLGELTGPGKGLEAMRLLLDYAKKDLHKKVINLGVYKDNILAIALYKKLGFEVIKKAINPINGREEYIMKLVMN